MISPPAGAIPALVNTRSGAADAAAGALARAGAGAFDIRRVEPAELEHEVELLAAAGHERIAVAGGDGSMGGAAAALRGTATALAVLPAGTLNHFARHLALPLDLDEAAAVALGAHIERVDVGVVNRRVFLNTSSAGAYVAFVRLRDRLEHRVGYRLASFVAALRLLVRLRTFRVTVEVDGATREYDTPLVFVGVGERELRLPTLGARVRGGRSGLHVMIVRHRGGARVIAMALAAMARGVAAVAGTPAMDAFLVERCTVEPHTARRRWHLAVDGEVTESEPPLEYSLARESLSVVTPAPRDPLLPPARDHA